MAPLSTPTAKPEAWRNVHPLDRVVEGVIFAQSAQAERYSWGVHIGKKGVFCEKLLKMEFEVQYIRYWMVFLSDTVGNE